MLLAYACLAFEQALHFEDIVKSQPLAALPLARAFSRGSLRSPK